MNKESLDAAYTPEEFSTVLKSSIKISGKNKILQSKIKPPVKLDLGEVMDANFFFEATQNLMAKRRQNLHQDSDIIDDSKDYKLDPNSCFLLLFLSGKALLNIIPDHEINDFEKNLHKILTNEPNNSENLFKIAKFKSHLELYAQSLEMINKAIALSVQNRLYRLWKAVLLIKKSGDIADTKIKNGSCCGSREIFSKTAYLTKIIRRLYDLPHSIESQWALLELSFSHSLTKGVDVEAGRFYAANIKKIDTYYGYLAWAYLKQRENNPDSIKILMSLISSHPKRPEAYYLAWNHYFRSKLFENAKEVATEAFLKVTNPDHTHFYMLFCLRLAKSYYYTGDFTNCIELLHKKYIEHPEYIIFLYSLAKYLVLSEEDEFSGVAKGILRELIRLCSRERLGAIYYWLCRVYYHQGQFPMAYKYSLKALQRLGPNDKNKTIEMQKRFLELKGFIEKIQRVQISVNQGQGIDDFSQKYEEIKEFHKPTAELIKADVMFLQGNAPGAISVLRQMINMSRLETAAYFKLIKFDPTNDLTTLKELLIKAKNAEIPSQIWVKAAVMYAKKLFFAGHHNKSFYILRVIAKLLPPLPYLDIPYCNTLQDLDNLQTITPNLLQTLKTKLNSPGKSRVNVRKYSKLIVDDVPLPNLSPKAAAKPEKVAGNKTHRTFSYDITEGLSEINRANYIESAYETNPVASFGVSSKPKFLFYIAKFAAISKRNIREGLLAIHDFKELLRLSKNHLKYSNRLNKAEKLECDLRTQID